MTSPIDEGRNALLAWEKCKPANYFSWDQNLGRVLRLRVGTERFRASAVRVGSAAVASERA